MSDEEKQKARDERLLDVWNVEVADAYPHLGLVFRSELLDLIRRAREDEREKAAALAALERKA